MKVDHYAFNPETHEIIEYDENDNPLPKKHMLEWLKESKEKLK